MAQWPQRRRDGHHKNAPKSVTAITRFLFLSGRAANLGAFPGTILVLYVNQTPSLSMTSLADAPNLVGFFSYSAHFLPIIPRGYVRRLERNQPAERICPGRFSYSMPKVLRKRPSGGL
jgi:hypothetical protein